MSILSIIFIALALAADSFAVALSVGTYPCTTHRTGLKIGIVFAIFQGLFPMAGAFLGIFFQDIMASLDHWIAFSILFLVGVKVLIEFIKAKPEDKMFDVSRWFVVIGLAVATSIDAFIVGIGLGLEVKSAEIPLIGLIIFITTFVFTFAGVCIGKVTKRYLSRWAGILGGLILIVLAVKILIEHQAFKF